MAVSKPSQCKFCGKMLSSRQGKYEHENSVCVERRRTLAPQPLVATAKQLWPSWRGKPKKQMLKFRKYVFAGASGSATTAAAAGPSTNPGGPNAPPAQQNYRWAPPYQPKPPGPEATGTPESLIHPNDHSSFHFS
ncbi:hypothetical protein FS837_002430 [Tulasnella sp. UAMH 9824]|nr:hypothetical protein FS837_002430 [Tulasnella sp. UAMH 9824]